MFNQVATGNCVLLFYKMIAHGSAYKTTGAKYEYRIIFQTGLWFKNYCLPGRQLQNGYLLCKGETVKCFFLFNVFTKPVVI